MEMYFECVLDSLYSFAGLALDIGFKYRVVSEEN